MKAVIFDFDGTLTYKSPNIWKAIWKSLSYETGTGSYFSKLFVQFMTHDISHQQWCDLTCDAFKKQNLNEKTLLNLAENIKLIDGFNETMEILKQNECSIHIVSGNVISVIKNVLKNNSKYFDSINANNFEFDDENKISKIIGTNYDFEGKAKFIDEFKNKSKLLASDICFVGNGGNDEWAHLSGCKTICINPDDTDASNKTKWHQTITNVTNLTSILPSILGANFNTLPIKK